MSHSRVPEEEIVPRGREIYEREVRPRLRPEDEGKFVVIDVQSGDYEVSDDEEEAFARAEGDHPGAVFFFSRVGSGGSLKPAHRIGAGSLGGSPNGSS